MHCYQCGREITGKSLSAIVVESHSSRIGHVKIHTDCFGIPSLTHYKQTIEWENARLGNIAVFKSLHRRLMAVNGSAGSVPVFLVA